MKKNSKKKNKKVTEIVDPDPEQFFFVSMFLMRLSNIYYLKNDHPLDEETLKSIRKMWKPMKRFIDERWKKLSKLAINQFTVELAQIITDSRNDDRQNKKKFTFKSSKKSGQTVYEKQIIDLVDKFWPLLRSSKSLLNPALDLKKDDVVEVLIDGLDKLNYPESAAETAMQLAGKFLDFSTRTYFNHFHKLTPDTAFLVELGVGEGIHLSTVAAHLAGLKGDDLRRVAFGSWKQSQDGIDQLRAIRVELGT